jgi:phosphonopyruvate decarboxylase
MIDSRNLIKFLRKKNINFYTGVPDSVTKEFLNELDLDKKCENLITTNEGSAVSFAAGYYLAKKKIPCVYLQNSGLGNAVNPLTSMCHKKVYSIPLLIIIGWRGSPYSTKDEPQHEVMGKITREMLHLLNIKNCILRSDKDLIKLGKLINFSKKNKTPIACLVENNKFLKSKKNLNNKKKLNLSRYEFIGSLLKKIKKNTHIVSTTGYTSRELNQIRKDLNLSKGRDFYMVGGMGHASILASSFAMNKKKSDVICLDGDGSFLMHMGSLLTNARLNNKNFKHVILNNFTHQSVGGQKTYMEIIKLKELSQSVGYKKYFYLEKKIKTDAVIKKFLAYKGTSLLEVKINSFVPKNLTRPKKLEIIKNKFMKK